MIKQDYTGDSNIIKRIVAILNKKAPLPLDQQGEVDWGTDGKVLGTDGVGGTKWVTASSGGGNVDDVKVNGSSVVDANKVANVTVPTALSDLQDDSTHRVVTDTEKSTWSGKQDALTAGTNIQINGTTISATDTTYSDATQSTAGLMSTTDKTKLDGIANGAEVNVQSDWNEADSTSDAYIANKPTIPAAQIQSDWTQADNTQADYIKNKPTIPAVNDGTLTIQQNGTTVGTFSANQSGDTTVNLTGGGSGGHTIWNRIKSALTQRGKLWFADASVSDASADDATKVEVVTELLNETAFDNLATDGTADGIYTFPDSGSQYLTADMVGYDNTASGLSATDVQDAIDELSHGISREFVSVTADGVKTNIQMLNELYALVDGTKVKCDSCLQIANRTLQIGYIGVGSYFMFHRLREVDSGNSYAIWDHVRVGSSSKYQTITVQPSSSISISASQGTDVLGSGTKYTLYY